jgi:hypothetical protein
MSSTNANNPTSDSTANSGPSTAIAAATAPNPTAGNSTTTNYATGSGKILLTERFLMDSSWPDNLVLNLDKSNWHTWSKRLRLLAIGQGFSGWLNGTLACPDVTTHPKAYWIWKNNDDSVCAFIARNISNIDEQYLGTSIDTVSSHTIYETL